MSIDTSNAEETHDINELVEYDDDFGDWKPCIFYVGSETDEPVPFWKWLRYIKEVELNCTWKELNAMCEEPRLSQYAGKCTGGHPNEPRADVFQSILTALGYSKTDFEVQNHRTRRTMLPAAPEKGTEEYICALRTLGDGIRKMNAEHRESGTREQRLSHPIIKHIAGQSFLYKHGAKHEDRAALLKELHELGYTEIKLMRQVQNKGVNRRLNVLERHLVEELILEGMEKNRQEGKQNRAAVKRHVDKELQCIREQLHQYLNTLRVEQSITPTVPEKYYLLRRSEASVKHHVEDIMGKRKENTFLQGSPDQNDDIEEEEESITSSPSPAAYPYEVLEEELKKLQENTTEAPEINDPDTPIVEPDEDNKRKEFFLENSLYGHQAIIAYMMHEENYKEILGSSASLIAVDFSEDSTPDELFEGYRELLEEVEKDTENSEVTAFADGWLRCDMIFRMDSGYVVLEIKQYAYDRESFANAQKARQQVASYSATLADNIRYYNYTHHNRTPLNGNVQGGLVAFEVQEDTAAYMRGFGRRLITLDKEEVLGFIQKRLTAIQEAADENRSTEMQQLSRKEEKIKTDEEISDEIESDRYVDIKREIYELRRRNGEALRTILTEAIDNLSIGIWDKKKEYLELLSQQLDAIDEDELYDLRSKQIEHALQEALHRGVITEGKVDAKKYEDFDRGEIIEVV